jgi:hypothetical protein
MVPARVDAAETRVNVAPVADPDVIPVVPYEAEPELTIFSEAVTATQPPVGTSVAPRNPALRSNELDPVEAVVVRPTCTVTAELTAGDDVAVVALIAETNAAVTAAFAGATVTRDEPSAATATSAMRFFNEIVFTIFLSLSQIKDFLLSGW